MTLHLSLPLLIAFTLASTGISAAEPAPSTGKGLAVHEWGVFRVSEDADFANAALRAEWDNLPGFAYGHIKGRTVPQHWGAVEIRKNPIIFFHATEPCSFGRVDFPGGMPGVWFPATVNPAVYGFEKQPKIGGTLEWNLSIKQCPNGWHPKTASPPEVSDKHWVSRMRQVKADELFARYSPNNLDVEREHFLFYDGIFPQRKWLQFSVAKDGITVTSRVNHPVFDVTVVDRRTDKVRLGHIAKVEAGQKGRR